MEDTGKTYDKITESELKEINDKYYDEDDEFFNT